MEEDVPMCLKKSGKLLLNKVLFEGERKTSSLGLGERTVFTQAEGAQFGVLLNEIWPFEVGEKASSLGSVERAMFTQAGGTQRDL